MWVYYLSSITWIKVVIWSGFDIGIHKPVLIGNINERCARLVLGLAITVCRVRKNP